MSDSLLEKIFIEKGHTFSDTERKLADYFLKLDKELTNKTIAQLANETNISQTSIFNFVKKLGFKGFQQFKIQLASQQIHNIEASTMPFNSDISPEDDTRQVAYKVINANINSLNILRNEISIDSLENVIEIIKDSERLHFFGSGGSSILALDAYHKFIRTDFSCNYIFDTHMQLSYSTKLNENDCVFLFSHSGLSKDMFTLAKQISKQKAKIILLTGNEDSGLIQYAYERIIILSEESIFRSESLTSRILYLTVIDILYTIIMYTDQEVNQNSLDNIRKAISVIKYNEE